MQRVTLTVPVESFLPGDAFKVFGNVDSAGRPTASIDFDNAIRGPTDFWTYRPPMVGYGEGGYGEGAYGGMPAVGEAEDHQVETPALYFGGYAFAVKTVDLAGNVSDGTPAEFAVFINSGAKPTRSFRQSGVDNGRAVFAFTAPAQFR